MSRTYLVFADIEGKLDVLRVECARCQRKGRYSVRMLIDKYGRNANMMKWKEQLNGDCPKRDTPRSLRFLFVAGCFTVVPKFYSPVAISVTCSRRAQILPGCGSQCWTCL
jgi:hypothetical protein